MSRTWFITGVNSGFGREMCNQLLARGDSVYGTVRDLNSVKELTDLYGKRFRAANIDMTDTLAIAPLVNRAFGEAGHIDVVMNNAGYGLFGPAEGLTDDQIRHQIDTNLIAPIQVARAAIPHLRKQGGGKLMVMSSYGGQATHPGASLYHASKWGIEGFFESLAAEVAAFNIDVTIVEPGAARTAFRKTAGARMGDFPDAYADSPLAAMFARLSDPGFLAAGDPVKMVKTMIECVEQKTAPKRLVLGSDSYAMLHKALTERLAMIESQQSDAPLTDF